MKAQGRSRWTSTAKGDPIYPWDTCLILALTQTEVLDVQLEPSLG